MEIAVCLANMNGVVDLNSLAWEKPVLFEMCTNERDALSYNREVKILQKNDRRTKVHCNTNRICELEDAVVDWIHLTPLDQPKLSISLGHFLTPAM